MSKRQRTMGIFGGIAAMVLTTYSYRSSPQFRQRGQPGVIENFQKLGVPESQDLLNFLRAL